MQKVHINAITNKNCNEIDRKQWEEKQEITWWV